MSVNINFQYKLGQMWRHIATRLPVELWFFILRVFFFFERKFTKTSCVWRVSVLTRISSQLADISQTTSAVGLFVKTNFLTQIRNRLCVIML
jgi:hypothetical protein